MIKILWAVLCFCGCLCGEVDPLNVGMELSYPPFEMIDKDGNPSGFSVELAQDLANYLKRPLKIDNTPFIGLIPSLKTGKIDVVISSLTKTDQRAKAIDFSIPYLTTGLCLLVNIDSSIQSITDVNQVGKIVVVKQGTTGQLYAMKYLDRATILILDKESSCVMEVAQGKADAFIYDPFSILKNWQKNQETTRPILKPFHKEYWAMGLKKGNTDLKKQINTFIENYKKNGDLERLIDKFLPDQMEEFRKMGVSLIP